MSVSNEPETLTSGYSSVLQGETLRRNLSQTSFVRVPVLLALLSAAAVYESRHMTALAEYDIWWHLRTGAWILQNHALPHNGLFSQYSDRPWIAYSWGFEVIAATVYGLLGLRGIPVLLMCFKTMLAMITFWLARGSRQNFWPAVALAAAGQFASPPLNVRPVFFSMLFFGVELLLLFKSRRTGSVRPLFWLPPLFALWANLHIQFVYGLFVLGLFFAAVSVEALCRWQDIKRFGADAPVLPWTKVGVVMSACFLATAFTAYFYHPYRVAWNYAHSTATYSYVVEMHAMNFRLPQHYVRLLLIAAAFFWLGRRRSLDLFQLLLLIACTMAGFHMDRDTWLIVLASIAVIADRFPEAGDATGPTERAWFWEKLVTASLLMAVLAVAVAIYIPSRREALLDRIGQAFPVRACDFIRENQLSAPIFNPFNWGGFLIWYLPDYPVAIDGRTDLYGDEIVVRQYKVLDGAIPPWEESTFTKARTLLLWKYSWLGAALSQSPRYRLVYEDDRAVVLVPVE